MNAREPILIGLCGPAGVGKSSVAAVWPQSITHAFADPIKDMVRVLLSEYLGLDHDLPDTQEGKATVVMELSRNAPITVRYLLQTLGTEWGRQQVHDRIWIDIGIASALRLGRDNGYRYVVFDDVRFDNEAQAIRDAGGSIVHVRRMGISNDRPGVSEHASEAGVKRKPGDWELCLPHDSREHLTYKVSQLVNSMRWHRLTENT